MKIFPRVLTTEIEIKATPETVWRVLVDFQSYSTWNPMIRQASGNAMVGTRLKVLFHPEGQRAHTFKPRLIIVEPARHLRWLGYPRIPLLIDGEHFWIITPKPDGTSHLLHGMEVYGLFSIFFGDKRKVPVRKAFQDMNMSHKLRAEGKL